MVIKSSYWFIIVPFPEWLTYLHRLHRFEKVTGSKIDDCANLMQLMQYCYGAHLPDTKK